jgi:hypothetical protein
MYILLLTITQESSSRGTTDTRSHPSVTLLKRVSRKLSLPTSCAGLSESKKATQHKICSSKDPKILYNRNNFTPTDRCETGMRVLKSVSKLRFRLCKLIDTREAFAQAEELYTFRHTIRRSPRLEISSFVQPPTLLELPHSAKIALLVLPHCNRVQYKAHLALNAVRSDMSISTLEPGSSFVILHFTQFYIQYGAIDRGGV